MKYLLGEYAEIALLPVQQQHAPDKYYIHLSWVFDMVSYVMAV